MLKNILSIISGIRLIPHLICLFLAPNRKVILLDLERWYHIIKGKKCGSMKCFHFCYIITFFPEYRNLFYYRIKTINKIMPYCISFLCPPLPTLYLTAEEIGAGLFIQHGFSVITSAKKIGKNCWINQQVTIGFSNIDDKPTIGNNVKIRAGAKIIGNIVIGDNCIIGANSVVIKDVPKNCTVVGVPGYIIRKDGIRCKELL